MIKITSAERKAKTVVPFSCESIHKKQTWLDLNWAF
jgi:hypothetical protein